MMSVKYAGNGKGRVADTQRTKKKEDDFMSRVGDELTEARQPSAPRRETLV